jgi:hypothetical protein
MPAMFNFLGPVCIVADNLIFRIFIGWSKEKLKLLISGLIIQIEKMAGNLCQSRNCMKIGQGSNSGNTNEG